jgi:hypothetical protein
MPQNKLLAKDPVSDIVDGEYDEVIEHIENYLNEHPTAHVRYNQVRS